MQRGSQINIAFDDANGVPVWIPATVDYVHGDKVGATLHGGGNGIWDKCDVLYAPEREKAPTN